MKDISRRDFIKLLGGGILASSSLLTACSSKKEEAQALNQEPQEGMMTYRRDPNTKEKVSLLGYGMMRLPTLSNSSAREDNDAIDQEMVNREVDYAIKHGVNYFDTSPMYCQGLSEYSTGIALSRHKRSEFLIATKMSNMEPETWSKKSSIQMFKNSLKQLRVDYIDYYLLHCIGRGGDALANFNSRFMDNGILDWLVEQKKLGIIKNLGFSYHGDIRIFDMLLSWHDEGKYHWDFAQIELNYLDWRYAKEINPSNTNADYLYDELLKRGIPAVIMEPLLGGRLVNVPDFIVEKMKRREPQLSVASWALRFAGTPKNVLTVLSGMTFMEHLKENIITFSPLKPLNAKEQDFLQQVADDIFNLKTIPCNDCKYCMPCPYGIDIPGVLLHYNKCINEGNIASKEKQDAAYRSQRRAFLIGYDREVPKLRQADHCIGCGQCNEKCPQRIDIPKEMERIDKYTEDLRSGRATI
ncbi:MAG: aldo/keto reductase [Prevotella sp.]|nr:aldo/keto reductase [Prevotella sp.]